MPTYLALAYIAVLTFRFSTHSVLKCTWPPASLGGGGCRVSMHGANPPPLPSSRSISRILVRRICRCRLKICSATALSVRALRHYYVKRESKHRGFGKEPWEEKPWEPSSSENVFYHALPMSRASLRNVRPTELTETCTKTVRQTITHLPIPS